MDAIDAQLEEDCPVCNSVCVQELQASLEALEQPEDEGEAIAEAREQLEIDWQHEDVQELRRGLLYETAGLGRGRGALSGARRLNLLEVLRK